MVILKLQMQLQNLSCIMRNASVVIGAPIAGVDCTAWTSNVLSNPYGRVREGSIRCQGGNRCWKRRAAIFKCTVAKDCNITTVTRRLNTKRTELFLFPFFNVPQSGKLKKIFFKTIFIDTRTRKIRHNFP